MQIAKVVGVQHIPNRSIIVTHFESSGWTIIINIEILSSGDRLEMLSGSVWVLSVELPHKSSEDCLTEII